MGLGLFDLSTAACRHQVSGLGARGRGHGARYGSRNGSGKLGHHDDRASAPGKCRQRRQRHGPGGRRVARRGDCREPRRCDLSRPSGRKTHRPSCSGLGEAHRHRFCSRLPTPSRGASAVRKAPSSCVPPTTPSRPQWPGECGSRRRRPLGGLRRPGGLPASPAHPSREESFRGCRARRHRICRASRGRAASGLDT